MRPVHFWKKGGALDINLLEEAKARVPSLPVLINMVSKRVRQLNAGFRPYVKPSSPDEDRLDTALREIAEGHVWFVEDVDKTLFDFLDAQNSALMDHQPHQQIP